MKKVGLYILLLVFIISVGFFHLKKEKNNDILTKIDLSTASIEQLEKIPYIGKRLAFRIVEYREKFGFSNLEELKKVKGIGEKTFNRIKDYLYISEKKFSMENTKININKASFDELISLPGIGKVYAKKIINHREIFGEIDSFDALIKIGIPKKVVESIRGMIEF